MVEIVGTREQRMRFASRRPDLPMRTTRGPIPPETGPLNRMVFVVRDCLLISKFVVRRAPDHSERSTDLKNLVHNNCI